MFNYSPHDYGQIAQRRAEKVKLKRMWWYLFHAAYLCLSLLFVAFVLAEEDLGSDAIIWRDYFLISYGRITDYENFNLQRYYIIAGTSWFVLYSLFVAKSVSELIDNLHEMDSMGKNPSIFFKMRLFIAKKLDTLIYYLFFPLSYMLIGIDTTSKIERNRFFVRHGWLSHLKINFFKRTIVEIDGYERVKELQVLRDFPILLSEKKTHQEALEAADYRTVKSLFKSKESFVDIFHIAEGYIRHEEKKYDKLLSKEEYEERLNTWYGGDINAFRVYDGREEIVFSIDLIKDIIDMETKRFSVYLEKYALSSSGLTFTRTYRKYYRLLKKDKKMLKMISQLKHPKSHSKISNMTEKDLIERINFLFLCYFRYIAAFDIINQYINLPAGTAVVKTEDYTLRMLTEKYASGKIVAIQEGRNDGQSEDRHGDELVNMFLIAWNYYNHSIANSFKKKVYNIFNLRDEKLEKVLSGEVDSYLKTEEIKKSLEYIETTPAPGLTEEQLNTAKSFLFGDDEEK